MKKVLLISVLFFSSLAVQAKVKKEDISQTLLKKALAENGIFRCSFDQTIKSDLTGDKLKKQIKKNCQTEISKINTWYKDKELTQRTDLLVGNGMKSALSHKKTL